jgi:tetratricopeptide (TPR) repeat protein
MRLVTLTVVLVISLSIGLDAQQGSISGHVLDQEGKPLTNVTVRLHRATSGQRFEAKTDSKGNYRQAGLPEGEYELSITKDKHSFLLTTHVGAAGNRISIIAGADGNILVPDGNIRNNDNPEAREVNFDLRLLEPYDVEQEQKVTIAGLRIPRKAEHEFRKAFETWDDLDEAKRHLEQAIAIAPNYEEALNNLGIIYSRRQQYSEAAVLFERAVVVNPQSISARLNLGGALLQLKQYERAAAENLQVLASHPNDALAHGQAGFALFYLRRYEEAISHLERAKQLNPTSILHPGYFLATVYDDLGRDESAIAEFAEFLSGNPQYAGRADVEYRLRQLCERRLARGDSSPFCPDGKKRDDSSLERN